MLDAILDFLGALLFFAYIYFGNMANNWFKYNVMGVRAEIYSDTGQHYLNKIIWATILGWISIPLAIILSLAGVGKSKGE